jgi:hypothetical protein
MKIHSKKLTRLFKRLLRLKKARMNGDSLADFSVPARKTGLPILFYVSTDNSLVRPLKDTRITKF